MNLRLFWISMVLLSTFAARIIWEQDTGIGLSSALHEIPGSMGAWHSTGDISIPSDVRSVLRADDILARNYEVIPGVEAQLLIVYYRSQRAGEMMHSPRNCLPGSGWEPISLSVVQADMGSHDVVHLNRYLVEKDGTRMLLVYWYQEHDRIVASEYQSRLLLMWDAFRRHRRDGALVRVSTVLGQGVDAEAATQNILQFIRAASPSISTLLSK